MDFQWGDSPPVQSTPHYRGGDSEQILEQLEFTPLPPIWGNSDTADVNTEQDFEELEEKVNSVSVSGHFCEVILDRF